MLGVNKVMLVGWLGQDPEMRYTAAQRAVSTLRLATQRLSYSAEGEKQKHTDWHTLVLNDKLAEFSAKHLRKGSKIFVEGELEYRWRVHHEYKHIKWQESLVVVAVLEIIEGMLVHDYPEDFPELPRQKKSPTKKTAQASVNTASKMESKPTGQAEKTEKKQKKLSLGSTPSDLADSNNDLFD